MPKHICDNTLVVCPYNKSHVIYSSKIQSHLIKCQKNYPPLAICPYNATHRMPTSEIDDHVKICDDKVLSHSERVEIYQRNNKFIISTDHIVNVDNIATEFWE